MDYHEYRKDDAPLQPCKPCLRYTVIGRIQERSCNTTAKNRWYILGAAANSGGRSKQQRRLLLIKT
eukprot:scaffold14581_cov40-Tisochrysis_lutea.AAC.2